MRRFGVEGLGVRAIGFRVWVQGLGFRVQGLGDIGFMLRVMGV